MTTPMEKRLIYSLTVYALSWLRTFSCRLFSSRHSLSTFLGFLASTSYLLDLHSLVIFTRRMIILVTDMVPPLYAKAE